MLCDSRGDINGHYSGERVAEAVWVPRTVQCGYSVREYLGGGPAEGYPRVVGLLTSARLCQDTRRLLCGSLVGVDSQI